MKSSGKKFGVLCTVSLMMMTVLLLGDQVKVSEAVICSPVQLSSCAGAIISNQQPSSECCAKLREQRPCLCGYLRDPNLKQYVNSPNAKRVSSKCGVQTPKC